MAERGMAWRGGALVATTAVVEGDVTLGDRVSVWWSSVLRGDDAAIVVGEGSNIQDLCMLHPDIGVPLVIGRDVTVGHHATVHCTSVGDRVLIGIGAIVLAGATVGEESIVAAGAVVPEGMEIPPGVLVAGVPARVRRDLRPEERADAVWRANGYWERARARA